MNLPRGTLLATALFTIGIVGCGNGDGILGSETFEPQFSKPGGCPDHPSCGSSDGPGGDARQVTLDISGNVIASGQGAAIEKESNAGLTLVSDTDFADALSFSTAAGSPTPGSLGGCVTDPADLATTDPAAVQRLIDHYDDGDRLRSLAVVVNLKNLGEPGGGGLLNHTWHDDGDDMQYRTRVIESSLRKGDRVTVVEGPTDVFTFTGGSVVSWNTSTGEAIACPNVGSVTVALTR